MATPDIIARLEAEIGNRDAYEWSDALPSKPLPSDLKLGGEAEGEVSPLTYARAAAYLATHDSAVGFWALGRCRMVSMTIEATVFPDHTPDVLFLQALELRPDFVYAWTSLAAHLIDIGTGLPDGKTAISCLAKAAELNPKDHNAWDQLAALVEESAGYTGELAVNDVQLTAKECGRRAVEGNPTKSSLWYRLARLVLADDTVTVNDETLTRDGCLQRALTVSSTISAQLLLGIAVLLDKSKELVVAEGGEPATRASCLVKALSMDPAQPWAWSLLGDDIEPRNATVSIGDRAYDANACFARALEEELTSAKTELPDGCRVLRLGSTSGAGSQGTVAKKTSGEAEGVSMVNVSRNRKADANSWTAFAEPSRVQAFAKRDAYFPLLPLRASDTAAADAQIAVIIPPGASAGSIGPAESTYQPPAYGDPAWQYEYAQQQYEQQELYRQQMEEQNQYGGDEYQQQMYSQGQEDYGNGYTEQAYNEDKYGYDEEVDMGYGMFD
jgi:hypothetical protein